MKNKIIALKEYVADHKLEVGILLGSYAVAYVAVTTIIMDSQHAVLKDHDAFLKEHDLFDKFYADED